MVARRPGLIILTASCAALALALAYWLTDVFLAPFIFPALWFGSRSALAPIVLTLIAPVLVGVTLGYAFGVLPWRRPYATAVVVAFVAAGLNVVFSVAAGGDLFASRGWLRPFGAIMLVVLFSGAAIASAHVVSAWLPSRRTAIGGIAFTTLAVCTVVGAYWWSQVLVGRAA